MITFSWVRKLGYIRIYYVIFPDLFAGSDILARPVFESSVTSVTVSLPGESPALWYRVDDESWTSYDAGTELEIDVDISTVSTLEFLINECQTIIFPWHI